MLAQLFKRKPKKREQTTFVYCPTCRLELCSRIECFVEDTDLVKYKCTQCGTISQWDFDAPTPILLFVRGKPYKPMTAPRSASGGEGDGRNLQTECPLP